MTGTVILDDLAVVSIRGEEAGAFLQSQLSANLETLEPGTAKLTSWNTAAGKTIASPWVMGAPSGSFYMALPANLAEGVLGRLRLYVLRSRVFIDLAEDLQVLGTWDTGAEAGLDGVLASAAMHHAGKRRLMIADASCTPGNPGADALAGWREADLRAGLPQVYPATSEKFIPQMLNLDVLGGVSFDKGCYPGQEVIARARYLGRVKRRMLLFSGRGGELPTPGDALGEIPSSTVVDACQTEEGWLSLVVLPGLPGTMPAGIEAIALPYALPA